MNELLSSIEKALESKNWYGALTVALILPDICGKIDNPQMGSKQRYKEWFDKYVRKYYMIQGTNFAFMSGGDCYAIRCAMLHEFSEDLSKHTAKEVINKYKFCSPDNFKYGLTYWDLEAGSEIEINIVDFCAKIRIGVTTWLKKSECNTNEIENFVKIW